MAKPVSIAEYRRLAGARLPRVLFDYADSGSYAEVTLRRNVDDLAALTLRQRVLKDVSRLNLARELFGETYSMPVALAPIGMGGMFARRGEVKAARAASAAGVPFCLSTMSICPIEEVARAAPGFWFQLYMMKDRAYMELLLARAKAAGARILVLTVDLPVAGARYRANPSAQLSPLDHIRRMFDGVTHPRWMWDVYLGGRPHTLGNLAAAAPAAKRLEQYWGWVRDATDSAMTWRDLEWLRARWTGPILLKGVIDVEDACLAADAGMEGLIVSNHGGRQLDSASSSIAALARIADAVGDRTVLLMDGGIRSGLDILKALASGAKGCLIGRAWVYALATGGEAGVAHMLSLLRAELQAAMALTGCPDVSKAGYDLLAEPPVSKG